MKAAMAVKGGLSREEPEDHTSTSSPGGAPKAAAGGTLTDIRGGGDAGTWADLGDGDKSGRSLVNSGVKAFPSEEDTSLYLLLRGGRRCARARRRGGATVWSIRARIPGTRGRGLLGAGTTRPVAGLALTWSVVRGGGAGPIAVGAVESEGLTLNGPPVAGSGPPWVERSMAVKPGGGVR
jgi:hypothetical protein